MEARRFILANAPVGKVALDGPSPTFSIVTEPLRALDEGHVHVRTLYLSNDPAQRAWIQKGQDPRRLYQPPVEQGQTMQSRNIGEVVESRSSSYKKGDLVIGSWGWYEQTVLPESRIDRKVENLPGLQVTQYLGAFGLTGLTAWYGLREIVRAAPSDTVVVSGAAGATGSMVVQIAKHIVGCKSVIGIAGDEKKCAWVESIGADKCVNYKSAEFQKDLAAATPDYADVFFDNVGGSILDFMLTRVKRFGRVAACGAISAYNAGREQFGITNWSQIVMNRIEVRGFIVLDAFQRGIAQGIIGQLVQAYKEKKLKISDENETVVETRFEDIPRTWTMLFEGGNTGKLVTKIVGGPKL